MSEELVIPKFSETVVPVDAVETTVEVATEPTEVAPKVEPTPEQEERQGKRRYERRLDKAYKERAQEKARADYLEKQLSEQRPRDTSDPGAPTLEQSGYDPEVYADAKAKYEVERTGKEANTKRQAEQQRGMRDQLTSAWEEKSDKGAEKYADWDEKVGSIKPNSPMLYAIFEAENGEDIAYYLGTHEKEATRIMGMHPSAQIREIGKLEARLAAEPVKLKSASKAPAPITPVTGLASPGATVITDGMDFESFRKVRNRQLGRR